MPDKPTDAQTQGGTTTFPTEDLPGTPNPNPPETDQQGVKGMDPKSETGTQEESKVPEGTPGVDSQA
jgi:hypothetical protein